MGRGSSKAGGSGGGVTKTVKDDIKNAFDNLLSGTSGRVQLQTAMNNAPAGTQIFIEGKNSGHQITKLDNTKGGDWVYSHYKGTKTGANGKSGYTPMKSGQQNTVYTIDDIVKYKKMGWKITGISKTKLTL